MQFVRGGRLTLLYSIVLVTAWLLLGRFECTLDCHVVRLPSMSLLVLHVVLNVLTLRYTIYCSDSCFTNAFALTYGCFFLH
jgi:hypothetical protein